jgi:hypothetical protein
MASITDIEKTAKLFADARALLAGRLEELNAELETAKRKHMADIKRAVNRASLLQDELRTEIEESPDLFVKPRTLVLHGIKCGFQKKPGRIEWADDAQVVKLIRKNFPDTFDVLVKTTEAPVKKALQQLSALELKKIAVNVTADADEVLIKDTVSDIDKLVEALLREAAAELETA